ncbi:MAG: copper chaperone PCu(A)C [Rhizobium sp.]|nr:copper chaperone PCu(A)C [Rhizobium sp.]
MIDRFVAVLLTFSAFSLSAVTQEARAADLTIKRAWSRVAPLGAPVLGGYLSIKNDGGEADRLLAVSSPISDNVQIHSSAVKDGVATMRQVTDGVAIPSGETVEFEPGELHLMLLNPKSRPGEGEKIPLTLVFEKAGPLDVELVVARSPPEVANEHQDHMQ